MQNWIKYKCDALSWSVCTEYSIIMPAENFESIKTFAGDTNNALQISFLILIWAWIMYTIIQFYKKMISKF